MSYRPMRFDPDYRPFVAPERIYVLPTSADPAQHRVLSPAGLDRKLVDAALQGKLSVHVFGGCPKETCRVVRGQLVRQCRRRAESYGTRLGRLAMAGAILAALGLINWVLPDPIPLADELLLTFGGAGLAYYAYTQRRKSLAGLRAKVEQAVQQLEALAPVPDPLLGRIYRAIRARSSPPGGDGRSAANSVEAESAWLVEHLDLHSLVERGRVSRPDLQRLVGALEDSLPIGRVGALERRLRRQPLDRRARRAVERLARRLDMSRDAITVYAEFYRIAGEVLEG
jgi:hypothetical protein